MFTLFKKNIIKAPIDGIVVPLKDVPDPAFSEGMIGDGSAIIPSSTSLVSPCSGVVSVIAATKHAIGITNEDGLEILVHIGLDTMSLNGNEFDVLVSKGDIVSIGTPLININPKMISYNSNAFFIPVIISNSYLFKATRLTNKKVVEAGVHILFEYERNDKY